MSRRRRDQRLAQSRRNKAVAVSATGLVLVLGGLFVSAAVRVNPTLRDEDLCPADSTLTPGTTLMLVDATDPWTDLRRTAIAREVAEVTSSVPRYTRVVVHVVRGGASDGTSASDQVAQLCNPGTPGQVASDAGDAGFSGMLSRLVSNPERARARYDSAFARVIDSLVARAGEAEPQDRSPILETLRTAVLADRSTSPRTIVMISDMYQNSSLCSFYREPRCLEMADRVHDPTVAGTHDLRGARVEILLLSPADGEFVPRETLLQFWHDYFARQDALITRVKRIEQ